MRAARGPSRLTRASSGEPGGRRHGPPPPTATVPPAHHPLTRASQPPTIYVATHAHCPSTHAPEPTNSSATSSTARVPAAPAHAANGNARRPPPAVRRSARTCVAGTRRRNCLPAAARRRPATNTARSTVGWPTSVADARWRRGPAGHRDPWRRAPPAVRRPQQRIPRCAPRTHVRASPARGGGAPTHPLQAWLGPSSDIVVCSHRERRLQQQRANERAVRRPQERSHRCAPAHARATATACRHRRRPEPAVCSRHHLHHGRVCILHKYTPAHRAVLMKGHRGQGNDARHILARICAAICSQHTSDCPPLHAAARSRQTYCNT